MRPGALTRLQGPQQRLARGVDALVRHLLGALRHRARQLSQRAPDEQLAHLRRPRHQRSLLLALGEHLAYQGPCHAASCLVAQVLRVPVHEGEAEQARLGTHHPRQRAPEDEEGSAEALFLLAVRLPVLELGVHAQLLLGEAAHLQGEVALVAVLPVHRPHRDVGGPGQLPGLHLLVAAPGHHLRRVPHGVAVHLPSNPLHPRKPPHPPGRLPRGRKVSSARVLLPTGWV